MITGIPFAIERIRAGRRKPGLLRQHLTAVQAAAAVCGAEVEGAVAGSQCLRFKPGPVRGGDYRHAIGSAGSCTLVLQTVLPALWFADGPSTLRVSGGTHNPAAPPADFLIRSWQPLLQRMGVTLDVQLLRHGFYPAGGGEVLAATAPVAAWQPLHLNTRGDLRRQTAVGVVAGVPADVAKREMQRAASQLGVVDEELRVLPGNEGPGNVLLVVLEYPEVTEVFSAFGERGVPAETVADRAAREARLFRDSGVPVRHIWRTLGHAMRESATSPRLRVSQRKSRILAVDRRFYRKSVRNRCARRPMETRPMLRGLPAADRCIPYPRRRQARRNDS